MSIEKYKKIRDMYKPKSPFEAEIVAPVMRSGKADASLVNPMAAPGLSAEDIPSAGDMLTEDDYERAEEWWGERKEKRAQKKKERKEEEVAKEANRLAREKGPAQVQEAIDKGIIPTGK